MAGYQVQTPNLFVNLSDTNVIGTQINLLNHTVLKAQQVMYATGPLSAQDLIGKLITFTGTAASFSCKLPTTAQVFDALKLTNESAVGNQIYNVPPTQRTELLEPKIGMTFKATMKNDTPHTVTLVNSNLNFQASYNEVFSGEIASFIGMVTCLTPPVVVLSRCCEFYD